MADWRIAAAGNVALLAFTVLTACGRNEPESEDAEHACAHAPIYGGQLIEIGEHFAQVELVHESATGKLTAYIWDGHVEHARPVAMKSISVTIGGEQVKLLPVSNPLTGDEPGRSSQFEGRSERLRDVEGFDGVLGKLRFGEAEFAETEFRHGE
ncbi:MAG: hypothetical protein ACYSX0_05910 [Planctomycetota bacterium]|jgi:hypothetical protein